MSPLLPLPSEVDVVVAGSGAGGLSAALCCAHHGLQVLVVEKSSLYGGCTAYSGGIPWIPANSQMAKAGIQDSPDLALQYLKATVGDRLRLDLALSYLDHAPKMLEFLEANTDVKFLMRPEFPDYDSEIEGASTGGRCLEPLPYDGRKLGPWLQALRQPRLEMTLFGGMMVSVDDIRHMYSATSSLPSTLHCLKLLSRFLYDKAIHGRATRLLAGNALAARLLRSAIDAGVQLQADTPVVGLLKDGPQIRGVEVQYQGQKRNIYARFGTVIATGGFPHAQDLRSRHIPFAQQHRSLAPEGNTGDGIALAEKAGAFADVAGDVNAYFAPVSVMESREGGELIFPHLVTDRAKPGAIAVNSSGRRFVNEALSYHDFVRAMQTAITEDGKASIPAYLVCDSKFVRRYGLGMVRPSPFPRRSFIRSGYLHCRSTLADLATELGIDPQGLQDTVARYNIEARNGRDPQFGKGGSAYNQYLGDPLHPVSRNNAPIECAPYYAIRIFTGDIGTSLGIRANANAQALDKNGLVIEGLYVCGNDMTSIMTGTYATGGITIGPALTFGYIAAMHICTISKCMSPSSRLE